MNHGARALAWSIVGAANSQVGLTVIANICFLTTALHILAFLFKK